MSSLLRCNAYQNFLFTYHPMGRSGGWNRQVNLKNLNVLDVCSSLSPKAQDKSSIFPHHRRLNDHNSFNFFGALGNTRKNIHSIQTAFTKKIHFVCFPPRSTILNKKQGSFSPRIKDSSPDPSVCPTEGDYNKVLPIGPTFWAKFLDPRVGPLGGGGGLLKFFPVGDFFHIVCVIRAPLTGQTFWSKFLV